jgi:DNA-binding CsgD family transcriptional regulator
MTVGTLDSNDVVVTSEGVSRVHAALERFGDSWTIRDLGSRNGTYENAGRVIGDQALRSGDEILHGRLRLVFHSRGVQGVETAAIAQPPALTARERDVLLALCRPLLTGDAFTEPASIRAIAAELVVSEAAVKQHLTRLYGKFDVEQGERRRVQLANAALARGAVRLGDLRPAPDGH